jgi:hypothetical protein
MPNAKFSAPSVWLITLPRALRGLLKSSPKYLSSNPPTVSFREGTEPGQVIQLKAIIRLRLRDVIYGMIYMSFAISDMKLDFEDCLEQVSVYYNSLSWFYDLK